MTYDEKIRRLGDAIFATASTIEYSELPSISQDAALDFSRKIAARAEALAREMFRKEEEGE